MCTLIIVDVRTKIEITKLTHKPSRFIHYEINTAPLICGLTSINIMAQCLVKSDI